MSGSAASGLVWQCVAIARNPADRHVPTNKWSVTAALFDVDSRYIGPVGVAARQDGCWDVLPPALDPGPRRLVLLSVAALHPLATSYLRTPALLVVAES